MKIFILLVIGYLMGSIPFGLWIGKIFFNKNLRELGSGNIGTTNTFRVLGIPAGVVVFLADTLKGTLAVLLPTIFHVTGFNPIIFGLCAVIGHTFPIFAKFKGGKAVATSGGIILGYCPLLFIYIMVVFFFLLFISSMVSFASLGVSLATLIMTYLSPIFHWPLVKTHNLIFDLIITILFIFIWVRHIPNMKRIINKTENTVPFGLGLFSNKKKKPK